jgi:RNA polymerase sigma-70 factor (ECF subfamily)
VGRFDEARARWPGVEVPDHALETWIAARGGDNLADLYLACACARGAAGAIEAFERAYAGHIRAILSRLDASSALLEEAGQQLRAHLFVGDAPRIAEYAGRGDLLAFVRVVVLRIALRLLERERPAAHEPDDELWRFPDGHDDPELEYLKRLYRDELKAAFAAAVAALPDRERAVLRYHLIDGLSIDAIGAVYQVHRATAARWLTGAREQLAAGTRRALMQRLKIELSEVDSLMRLLDSNLDASAARLLG